MYIFKLTVRPSASSVCKNACCFCFTNKSRQLDNILFWLDVIASWGFSRSSVIFICFAPSMCGCSWNADDSANRHSAVINRRRGVQKPRAALSCLAQRRGWYPFGQQLQVKEPKLYLNPCLKLSSVGTAVHLISSQTPKTPHLWLQHFIYFTVIHIFP